MNPIVAQLATEIEKTLKESGQLNLMSGLAKELSVRSQKALKSRVISATSLSEEQKNKIKKKIDMTDIEFIIDENILGGLIIEVDGKRQDFSLKRKVNLVKNNILE